MKKLLFLLLILVTLPLFASAKTDEHKYKVVDVILERMNTDEILNDSRGAMPSEYKYSFVDGCHFKVHSEWYGQTHGIIDDEIIPLGEVKIEKLREDGKYYLFFKCLEDEKCIPFKGDNTGEPYGGMRIESIVPAGSSLNIFNQLKGYFEKLSLLCAADAEENRISSIKPDGPAPAPGALPEIFRPLSWGMNIKELKKLFPSAEHFETSYTSPENEKMISSMVFNFKWAHFGEAHLSISHHNYKRIDIIGITTTETRPECFETLPAPEWCRTTYSDELVRTLTELKKIITTTYGPPIEYVGGYREAAGLPPDPREKGNKWELEGYNLFLTITVGEEEDWAVGLQAVRRADAPPAPRNSGHVIFYVFDSDDTSYGVEGFQDFIYYYGNIEPWLKKNNLSYSFNEDKEIEITTSLEKLVSFTPEDFLGQNDIGVIIIKPDGTYKMIQGVWTNVDLALEIEGYLGEDIKK
jgi:hypothetical protein